ncbi:hypothetical protein AKO1_011649, partial [Acrasis kona]
QSIWKLLIQTGSILIVLIAITVRSIEFVLYVRLTKKLQNYLFLVSNILLPVGSNIVDWPICLYRLYISGSTTKEMTLIPKWNFLFMAALDSTGLLLSTLATSVLSGPLNVSISSTIIGFHMLSSFVFIGSRYNSLHVGGLLIILLAVGVQVFTMFELTSSIAYAAKPHMILWISILLLSHVPISISNLYKYKIMRETNVDLFYMNAMTSLFQLPISLLMFPIIFIPLPYPISNTHSFPDYLSSSFQCLFDDGLLLSDPCEGTLTVYLIMLFNNCIYGFATVIMLKCNIHGSQSNTIRSLFSSLLFLSKKVAGESRVNGFSALDIESLIILCSGVFVYHTTTEAEAQESLVQWFRSFFKQKEEDNV